MDEKKRSLYTLIALLVVTLLILSYIYVTYNQPETPEKTYETFGSLRFPQDEGAHNSGYETYSLYMNLSSGSENYYFMVAWNLMTMNSITYYSTEFLYSNITSGKTTVIPYKDFSNTSSSDKKLDMRWEGKNGGLFSIKRTDSKKISEAEYRVACSAEKGNESFYLDLRMVNMRGIAGMGLNGTGNMGSFGLLKGYFQTDIYVSGNIKINNKTKYVSGRAMFQHMWGFVVSTEVESVIMHMENKGVVLMRFYLQGSKDPEWEYFYLIKENNYTVFITHKEKTIGAEISPTKFKDLKGERYDAYVVDYFIDPQDPSGKRCYPRLWYVNSYYDNYEAYFHPMIPNSSPEIGTWEGFMEGKDVDGYGWGFSHVFKSRTRFIKIRNISAEVQNIGGKNVLNVTANISSGLPLLRCDLHLNISISGGGSENNTVIQMRKIGENLWQAYVDLEKAEKVYLRVYVEDRAYVVKISEEKVVEII